MTDPAPTRVAMRMMIALAISLLLCPKKTQPSKKGLWIGKGSKGSSTLDSGMSGQPVHAETTAAHPSARSRAYTTSKAVVPMAKSRKNKGHARTLLGILRRHRDPGWFQVPWSCGGNWLRLVGAHSRAGTGFVIIVVSRPNSHERVPCLPHRLLPADCGRRRCQRTPRACGDAGHGRDRSHERCPVEGGSVRGDAAAADRPDRSISDPGPGDR